MFPYWEEDEWKFFSSANEDFIMWVDNNNDQIADEVKKFVNLPLDNT